MPPPFPLALADALAVLRRSAPAAFPHWEACQDAGARCYATAPLDNCSVLGHRMAGEFADFLRPSLRGRVLDVGCGPLPVPSYLLNYPARLLAGVDPLPTPAAFHPFTFVQGVAELLPWPEATFDVVVAATSLDHVLLLDEALAEARRVLHPGGRFVVWITLHPTAPPWQRPSASPSEDGYHLFHLGPWLPALIARCGFVLTREAHPVRGCQGDFYDFAAADRL